MTKIGQNFSVHRNDNKTVKNVEKENSESVPKIVSVNNKEK